MMDTEYRVGEMTEEEYLELEQHVCRRKVPLGMSAARKLAEFKRDVEGEETYEAYRCPFGSPNARDEHWHIGRAPSLHHVYRLQLAVKFKATRDRVA